MTVSELGSGVRETQEVSSSVLLLRQDQVVFNQNGVDLRREAGVLKAKSENQDYEIKCFSNIVGQSANNVIFGPLIVDYLLGRSKTSSLSRPDAIGFDTSEDQTWKITELFEFKSKKFNSFNRKLSGFSRLLSSFREDPRHLQTLVTESCREILSPPQEIITPLDEEITVMFVFPNSTSQLEHYPLATKFRTRQMRVE